MDKRFPGPFQPQRPHRRVLPVVLVALIVVGSFVRLFGTGRWLVPQRTQSIPHRAAALLAKCRHLNTTPGPPPDFYTRNISDRFQPGTKSVLITNATIWTGNDRGNEVVTGDVLLDGGIIRGVGTVDVSGYEDGQLVIYDAHGAWVSPGIVDMHSHIGVGSAPRLVGSSDTNSHAASIQPWLRSIDGLNTHDLAYELVVAGGVTTSLVLPGSAGGIGGQAFTIKLRPTTENTPTSMLLEPPHDLNGSTTMHMKIPPRWRQMKHACGENPSIIYHGTRMDTMWSFRQAYEKARLIKQNQDDYCEAALAGKWEGLGAFPEELQWEALVDVLRGRVKVHNHCYEAVDLDNMIRLTHEFKFPIAAFHHAHETYLVPDLLKKAYGHPPAVAMFASLNRYKREAYRGSEFAPAILASHGIDVVMKSDHAVLNSQYLLHEAQQAHHYGLPDNLALASVTSTPARITGMDHRIGYVKTGFDADIVVWDSHPLALGASPKQVWIDGIAQLENPHAAPKPKSQSAPQTPDYTKEAALAVMYRGEPPLEPLVSTKETVVFANVSEVYLRSRGSVKQAMSVKANGAVVVRGGEIVCIGTATACRTRELLSSGDVRVQDLGGGALVPGLTHFGTIMGLGHIQSEETTMDGAVPDVMPSIAGGAGGIVHAKDGLLFGSRHALVSYHYGVTSAIASPQTDGGLVSGLTVAFSTGASHKLERGAVIADATALHVVVSMGSTQMSVSTQLAALRNLLLGGGEGELGRQFRRVAQGELVLVVDVHNADAMASLIELKTEIVGATSAAIRMTFSGGTEAHLLAKEIAASGVGVIVHPVRPYPSVWEMKRILPGPPLSADTNIGVLLAHNVTVGVGNGALWSVRNTRWDVAWAALEVQDMSKTDALALGSVNVEQLLGVEEEMGDLVATQGGTLLDFEAKVVGIVSARRGVVDLL